MSRHQPIRIAETVLLLVEGKDDEGFLRCLCEHIGLNGVDILIYEGKTHLRSYLEVLPLLPGYEKVERIGIIRDADEDATGAFMKARYYCWMARWRMISNALLIRS